jgi:ATP-dependent DNA helicase PIF1
VNFGLSIPAKDKRNFAELSRTGLARVQTHWKNISLLIVDEKFVIGRAQRGRVDRRLQQAFPSSEDEILVGLPAIVFGDFCQLPPIDDTPLYSTKPTVGPWSGLTAEGRTVFESFTQSVTLQQVFRQQGDDPEQINFQEALLRLREYKSSDEDYTLFSTRFWPHLSPAEREGFADILHLLPTKEAVKDLNTHHLA